VKGCDNLNIKIEGIHKSFGPNIVLRGVELEINPGEVHALMGENGAGKSTLMNILTGSLKYDKGMIYIDNEPKTFASPIEAEMAGITFIHQEMNTWQDMTVVENLFVNKELKTAFGFLDTKEMNRQATEIFQRLGVEIPLDVLAKDLSVGSQQMVEIAKALMTDAKVLIMDEPTSALTNRETTKLFEVIDELKKKNVAIVYISHRMEEIFQISDKITVMRDGETIDTKPRNETNLDEVVRKLVGREIVDYYPKRDLKVSDKAVVKIENLGRKNVFENISFELKEKEVLGLFGLMGSGRTEVMRAIYGIDKYEEGKCYINRDEVKITPQNAHKYRIGIITENRKTEGLHLEFSIIDNIALPNINNLSKGLVSKKQENDYVTELVKMLTVKTENPANPASSLSGGNQQKVVLAKWIGLKPKILIMDEPTRGVDVGAKQEIYKLINKLVEEGISIILVSSELPEVMGISDRIIVMHEGRISGMVSKDATSEQIMTLATGGHEHV